MKIFTFVFILFLTISIFSTEIQVTENPDLTIHQAVADSNFTEVKRLLKADPNLLESQNEFGLTPLNQAAFSGDTEIFRYLLVQGADITTSDNDASNLLHNACAGGHMEIIKFLIEEKNFDINAADNNGTTALHFALGRRFPEIARYLINKGADLDAVSNAGSSAIHNAVSSDDIEIVRLLAEKGCELNIANDYGVYPIHYAAYRGNIPMIELLIEKGADIHLLTDSNENPLIWAIVGRRFEAADFLVTKGADINGIINHGKVPFHSAVKLRRESIEYLLEKGANINAADTLGTTPLHEAAWSGRADIIGFMIDSGAKVNAVDNQGRTPLYNAMYRDSLAAVQVLLDNGAKVDSRESTANNACVFSEGTALHIAVSLGKTEYVRLLTEASETDIVNVKSQRYGRTVLHDAAIKGFLDITEYLIDSGADINVKDNEKKTPLYYAQKYRHKQIVNILQKKKAQTSALDKIDITDLLSYELKDDEAFIWYLNHSGWAFRTNKHLFIVDYFEDGRIADTPSLANGKINPEEIKDQNVIVMSTHEHGDHFDPVILEWKESLTNVQYVMGFEPQDIPDYTYIAPRETKIVAGITITSIKSNDSGGGFLMEADGITILHPGDHANRQHDFSGPYMEEIEFLKSMKPEIDISFMPISGCGFGDQVAVKMGVYKTLEELNPKIFFPMHSGWGEYRYQEFVEQAKEDGFKMQMKYPQNDGDRFFYKNGKISKF